MSETALLSHLIGVPWLIHGPALQTLIELAQRQPPDPANLDAWKSLMATPAVPEAIAEREGQPLAGARRAQIRDGVAVINVIGPIFRYANLFTEMSGATALATVASDLAAAVDSPAVRGIVLNVDSPGGQATAIAEVAAQIRAAGERKPLAAYVDGMAGSAGYWLASAAPEVVLGAAAVVGALGAVLTVPPKRRDAAAPIEIVSSQTPNKRPDVGTDAGRAELQGIVDRLAEEFLGAVAGFRGLDVAAVVERSRGGGYLVGRDAVDAGFADRLGSFEDVLARLAAGDAGSAGGQRPPSPARFRTTTGATMAATETKEAAIPAAETAAPPAPPAPLATAVDHRAEERARCAAIIAAQKPGFQALAQMAIAEGWSAATFGQAQDASAAAVAEAGKAAQLAAFNGSLPQPVATAPTPADKPLTEAEKRQATWDADASLRAEFGEFAAYSAYLDAVQTGKVRHVRRAA